MKTTAPLLSANLTASYAAGKPVLLGARVEIRPGEILGLVGQSGSGKSTMALAILRLLGLRGGEASGSLLFERRDLFSLSDSQMREVRGREIGLVLQSPLSSLNPALRVGTQLEEAWRAHARGSREDCRGAICAALDNVCLPASEELLCRYPWQLSVGQAQRVLIAMAILHRPALLIADEPTSALDVITQAGILRLFGQLNRDLMMSILYISHDLLSVGMLCDRIAILHEGRVVECAPTREIFEQPSHPYTQHLIASLPRHPSFSGFDLLSAGDATREKTSTAGSSRQ